MRILLVSTMRDEGPHLLEWVAHHRALGVTDFLIYTNECSDGTVEMLRALAPFGVVQRHNVPPKGKSIQWHALKEAWRDDLRKAADWVLCIDCDEFIALRDPLQTLGDLVHQVGEADAIMLPWRLFGANGERRLRDAPTTEVFTRAAPPDLTYPVGARQFKTLFRARGVFGRMGVHRPRARKNAVPVWVNGSGETLSQEFAQNEQRLVDFTQNCAAKLVQLHHYSLRSAQSFLLKRVRGLPNRKSKPIDLMYWVERNFNTVEDRSIQRHAGARNHELEAFLSVPGLSDLHAAAHLHHHARFEAMMRDEAMLRLYGRLLMTPDSAVLQDETVLDLRRRFLALNG